MIKLFYNLDRFKCLKNLINFSVRVLEIMKKFLVNIVVVEMV